MSVRFETRFLVKAPLENACWETHSGGLTKPSDHRLAIMARALVIIFDDVQEDTLILEVQASHADHPGLAEPKKYHPVIREIPEISHLPFIA